MERARDLLSARGRSSLPRSDGLLLVTMGPRDVRMIDPVSFVETWDAEKPLSDLISNAESRPDKSEGDVAKELNHMAGSHAIDPADLF